MVKGRAPFLIPNKVYSSSFGGLDDDDGVVLGQRERLSKKVSLHLGLLFREKKIVDWEYYVHGGKGR